MVQARNYVFTIYDMDWTLPLDWEQNHIRYCVFQHEVCPNTGRDHYQGYVEFTRTKRNNAVYIALGIRCTIDVRRGTRDQARAYSMKEESRQPNTIPTEIGEWVPTGRPKVTSEDVMALLKEGASLDTVIEKAPSFVLRYRNSIESLHTHFSRTRFRDEREIQCVTLWGPPGVGKSREARVLAHEYCADKHIEDDYYSKNPGTKWWNGYSGQEVVIMDDVSHKVRFRHSLPLH